MFIKFVIFLLSFSFSFVVIAGEKVPKQLITISGKDLNKNIKKSFKVDYLEQLKITSSDIFDPYQKGKKFKFEGVMLEDLFTHFSKNAKAIRVVAINGYEVTINRKSSRVNSLLFAFRQDSKYISVKMMGPLRIVRTGLGIISEEELILEGIDWVWMVKELIFE